MRWAVVCLAVLAMTGGDILSKGLGADNARLPPMQPAPIGHAALVQAQSVSQVPAGYVVPVTADNFNRAETDMNFGKIVKGSAIGNLSHRRELYSTNSPAVPPNPDPPHSPPLSYSHASPLTSPPPLAPHP